MTRLEAEDHAFARRDADGNGFITEREARAVPDCGGNGRGAAPQERLALLRAALQGLPAGRVPPAPAR